MKIIEGGTIKKKGIHIICVMTLAFQLIYGQDPPVEFAYNQSTLQAFYFFNTVTVDGLAINSEDWVAAFNGDICVGARQWDESACGGGVCDVPVMGDDGSSYSEGYMQSGGTPTFKVYDVSLGSIFDVSPSQEVDVWSIMGFNMNELLMGWSFNPADYQYNGSVTAQVNFSSEVVVKESDMVGAFINGEIRGGINGSESPFGNIVFLLMIFSNETSGETVEFKFYDPSLELYIDLNESIEFTSDMIIGDAMDPFILTTDYCSGDIDDCGVCNGGNADNLGCGCFEAGPSGCDNTCGSTLEFDECGVCGSGGIPEGECDCNGNVNDECGICDGGGVADGACDCDGNIEDVCSVCGGPGETTWYADTDEDGLGDPNNSTTNCEQPEGYVADDSDSYPDCTTNIIDNCGECDGNNSTCTGCEDEVACNTGEENECVYASTWYADIDEDGLGDVNSSMESCEQPDGYVADSTDEEPDCLTNDTDECGECGGNESDASNCLSIDTYYVNNFSINSIYPNPFNPVVNIDLSIDIVGHLQLSVFTIEGIQIKTIYNGPSSIGESTFTWRPENRASGFYFVSAVIDNQVKTQKVLFLK